MHFRVNADSIGNGERERSYKKECRDLAAPIVLFGTRARYTTYVDAGSSKGFGCKCVRYSFGRESCVFIVGKETIRFGVTDSLLSGDQIKL